MVLFSFSVTDAFHEYYIWPLFPPFYSLSLSLWSHHFRMVKKILTATYEKIDNARKKINKIVKKSINLWINSCTINFVKLLEIILFVSFKSNEIIYKFLLYFFIVQWDLFVWHLNNHQIWDLKWDLWINGKTKNVHKSLNICKKYKIKV